ncbi:MAG: hypothetical protein P1U46_00305 [Patescibacteria group bacterium]|nr:hypothetical protein [Patescibacteria group bacterium]
MISYSHLIDISIFFEISIIFELNLYTHKLARFHINSFGFSTTSLTLFSLSTLKIPYFSGSLTCFTKTAYQLYEIIFSISDLSKIVSQFSISKSSHSSIHHIAAAVHFSSHCSM